MSTVTNNPLITVLMAVYNADQFLNKAIDSILNQTYQHFEFLIVNDASTDKSEAIINSYTDSRIRYLKNTTNLGLPKSLNLGLLAAKGDWIARMDADDISHPSRIKQQIDYLLAHPHIKLLGTGVNIIDEFGDKFDTWNYPNHYEEIKILISKSCCFAHPSVMYYKTAVLSIGMYNEQLKTSEDYELWIRLLQKNQGANLPQVLVDYRVHNNQMSANNIYNQTLNCLLIKSQTPFKPNEKLFDQLLASNFSLYEIQKEFLITAAFWIHLYTKMKYLNQVKSLLLLINDEMYVKQSDFKRTIYTINMKCFLKLGDYLNAFKLFFKFIFFR